MLRGFKVISFSTQSTFRLPPPPPLDPPPRVFSGIPSGSLSEGSGRLGRFSFQGGVDEQGQQTVDIAHAAGDDDRIILEIAGADGIPEMFSFLASNKQVVDTK